METITITAQKGGVGKTTTAAALGAALRKYRGARVLYVDLDPQRNLTKTLGADDTGQTIAQVLQGEITAEEAIQHTEQGDVLPASMDLVGADRLGLSPRVLRLALKGLDGAYGYCIIDTPPALGILSINALTAAHRAIIPALADAYSVDSIRDIQGTLETVRQHTNKSLDVSGVLITHYNPRTTVSRYYAERLEEEARAIGSRLLSTRIRECSKLREAAALQEDIYTLAPRSNAAQDYRDLMDELTSR